jgi:hypothetical protein
MTNIPDKESVIKVGNIVMALMFVLTALLMVTPLLAQEDLERPPPIPAEDTDRTNRNRPRGRESPD